MTSKDTCNTDGDEDKNKKEGDDKQTEEENESEEQNAENAFSMGAFVQVVILFYQVDHIFNQATGMSKLRRKYLRFLRISPVTT